MSWGTHPDTLTMATASGHAKAKTGECGTLAYLKAYRDAYEELANGERGVEAYVKGLDVSIAKMENGTERAPELIDAPMMGTIKPQTPWARYDTRRPGSRAFPNLWQRFLDKYFP
jgi:hypothetical protein